MVTPQDGTSPEVHMFVWDLTGPERDGDFDSTVVFHELGHGINHRLVGGGGKNQLMGGDGLDTYVIGLADAGTTIIENHGAASPHTEQDTILVDFMYDI